MAAPRSALSARISAVRSVTTVPTALTSSSWSPGCLPRTRHAPIGGGTAAGGPFGQRLGPPKVMDRSQWGARTQMRHRNTKRREVPAGASYLRAPRTPLLRARSDDENGARDVSHRVLRWLGCFPTIPCDPAARAPKPDVNFPESRSESG